MGERLTESQIRIAKSASRNLEAKWRILTHAKDYSEGEVKEALSDISFQAMNFRAEEALPSLSIDAEIMEQVFVGLYHYSGFSLPPELKYKPNHN